MQILVCGDSYFVPDPNYPGLHWTEKLLNFSPDFSISNLAQGGSSNALIALQLLHGLKFIKPDFVILGFTSYSRYEVDKDADFFPTGFDTPGLHEYHFNRYQTNMHDNKDNKLKNEIINKYLYTSASENFEKIKNYFYISMMLDKLIMLKIPFCFTLGGFAYKYDYVNLINSNYLENTISKYEDFQILTNLWYHGNKPSPYFHVDDEKVQRFFAYDCYNQIQQQLTNI